VGKYSLNQLAEAVSAYKTDMSAGAKPLCSFRCSVLRLLIVRLRFTVVAGKVVIVPTLA
jgi:hypothetical protein